MSISLTGRGRRELIDRQTSALIKVRRPGWLLPGASDLLKLTGAERRSGVLLELFAVYAD